MLQRIINIFELRTGERRPVALAVMYFIILNAINIYAYWDKFSALSDNYHRLFVNTYAVSGFDPLTYEVISQWFPAYNIYRHPLLAFFMYPLYLANQGLIWLTGMNFAAVLTAMVLVVCSTYSYVFLYRILRNVIGISHRSALSLTAMYFSFGYIMLSSLAPDHFVMSQFCLLLTLWLGGEKLRRSSALNLWQTVALFILTAGISLNNGLKVFLAAMVTRRQRFFRWQFLLLGVVLPSALIWGVAKWEYKTWQWPKEVARHEAKIRRDSVAAARLWSSVSDTIQVKDSVSIKAAVDAIKHRRDEEKKLAANKKKANSKMGKPFMDGEFMRWTDQSTSRTDAAVENLFGEAVQLHSENALGDVMRSRPVVVRYTGSWRYVNYSVEAVVVALFLIGIWCGRKRLFLWTAMSLLLMDMTLHMGLGFGINEIYIMSAHYLFVMPIAMGYLLKRRESMALTALTAAIALWCMAWNMTVIVCNIN